MGIFLFVVAIFCKLYCLIISIGTSRCVAFLMILYLSFVVFSL